MENTNNLPDIPKKENLHYLYNPNTRTYDVIDLATGKMIRTEGLETSPVTYSLALCDYICDLVRNGSTLRSISNMPDMPSYSRLMAWESLYPEFKMRVHSAKKQRAEAFADKALEIALTPMNKDQVPAAKLAVDTLKWRAEKADPDTYGTKKESDGPKTAAINITLHTGVLDSKAPKDIIVDEFGNFKGFDGDEIQESSFTEVKPDVVLNRDRFTEINNGREKCSSDQSISDHEEE